MLFNVPVRSRLPDDTGAGMGTVTGTTGTAEMLSVSVTKLGWVTIEDSAEALRVTVTVLIFGDELRWAVTV